MKRENTGKQEGLLWITLGLLLIAAALFLASYNLYDSLRAERSVLEITEQLEECLPTVVLEEYAADPTPLVRGERTVIPDYVLSPSMEMPVETINGIDFIGVLQIPSLELELPIISRWSYPDLKIAPCRYSGSAYLNNLVICGHNYTAHFGTLKDLRAGDRVTFIDMAGNVFSYQVREQEILQPAAIEDMETGDWDLTLFTCTVGGQSRVAIRCELEEN